MAGGQGRKLAKRWQYEQSLFEHSLIELNVLGSTGGVRVEELDT